MNVENLIAMLLLEGIMPTGGVKIHVRDEEIDLAEIEGEDLIEILDELSDEEIEEIASEIRHQLSDEQLEELEQLINRDYEEDDLPMLKESSNIALPPVILTTPADGEMCHNFSEFSRGIYETSMMAGAFTGLVNAGLTGDQAFAMLMTKLKHEQDMEMFNAQAEVQKEIKDKELAVQREIQGLKQLLTEE